MKTNKKRALVSSLLVAATTLSLCVSASATELRGASTTSPYKPVVTLSSSSVSEVKNALRTTKDIQGNSLGPSDFVVSNNSVYLLNTANNAVYKYQGNEQTAAISLDDYDIVGTALSVRNNDVYVLDNNLSVSRISNGHEQAIGSVQNDMYFDNAIDFSVTSKYVYVSEPTSDGGKTLCYLTDPSSGKLVLDRTVNGYMVNENTFYRSKLITENGENAGHSCVISILDAEGNTIDTITLHSDNYIAGAQYLGKNQDGLHIVKQFDMSCYSDGTCDVEETIRTVNTDNDVVTCDAVENNVPSMDNQVTVQDGKVYQFSSSNARAVINEVNTEKMTPAAQFSSKLKQNPPVLSTVTNTTGSIEAKALPSISRSSVMRDAKAYHSSFTWSCSNKNLAALTNWKKPRYIKGAGTYSYMPYCWGGFSTTAQYKTAMNNSGRVGNINTPKSGHVANTYGLDCSGYVSRCWLQPTKYGTATIGTICNKISYNALRTADALNKSGSHIVLFDYSDAAGNYTLYEATTLNQYDRVAHTSRSVKNLSSGGYVALSYKGVTN